MENEVIEEVLARIDSVGEAISEGAVAGFEVLVRQAMLSGIGMTVGALFFFGVGAYIYTLANKFHDHLAAELVEGFDEAIERGSGTRSGYMSNFSIVQATNIYEYGKSQVLALKVFAVSFGAIGLPIAMGAVYRFANPAYYAIKEVLHTFG